MHTIVEVPTFIKCVKELGLTGDLHNALIETVSNNPSIGSEIAGTGGLRKFRFAGVHKGKRGSYRVITFYSGYKFPVFLLYMFSKGDKSDLSPHERNAFKKLTSAIIDTYEKPST